MTITEEIRKIGNLLHADGWRNALSGLGVLGRDRAVSTTFCAGPDLPDETLEDLYHYNDLAALICDVYPEDALRRGFSVPGTERWKDLAVRGTILEAARWGRLYGRCVVVIGTDDTSPADQPIDLSRPWPIRWLEVYDRRQVYPETPKNGLYASADRFRITKTQGASFVVHRSRCLVFGGAPTSQRKREARQGADLSVLQRPYEVMRDFGAGYLALGNMLTDASQAVFKMRGLIDGLSGKDRETLIARLSMLDASRSIANAVMLDSNGQEEFSKVATSFAGVPDTIDRLMNRLSMATRIPVTRLAGQAPAGLNATGASDTRAWYDVVESYRETEIEPPIQYLARVELGPNVPACVEFPPLWQPTETERATTGKTLAEAGGALHDRGAITTEELAQVAGAIGIVIDPNVPRETPGPMPAGPAPALPVVQGDDEETVPDEMSAAYAASLTAAGSETCAYHPTIRNRCRICGVERERGIDPATRQPIIAWRAIPR